MNLKFEIDKKNEIRIWDLDNPNPNNAPCVYQPTYPGGQTFESKKEAEDYALTMIEWMSNENPEFSPGMSREEPKIKNIPIVETAIVTE